MTKNNLSGLTATHKSLPAHFSDYEWIVVDGASKDGTKEFLATLSGAKIITEPDNSPYEAMNKGIECAAGHYIIFMNAGDIFADADIFSAIERAVKAHDGPDFIYGDALEANGFYKKARPHTMKFYGMFTHHQSMIYKRSVIGDSRYDTSYKIAADYDFTLRFLEQAGSFHYIPACLCVFGGGGLSHRFAGTGRKEEFAIRRKYGCGRSFSISLYVWQFLALYCRRITPALYRRLKRWSGNNRSGYAPV
ncbi:MAG: glycosyltransferase [Anaerovoracaceae bacterium]